MNSIKITPTLLAELRKKALATVPGPWKVVNIPGPDCSEDLRIVPCDAYGNSCGGGPIGDVFGGYKRPVAENAAYIAAANPAVVLVLVAEIERLRATQEDLVESLASVLHHTDLSGWALGERIEKHATELLDRVKGDGQ